MQKVKLAVACGTNYLLSGLCRYHLRYFAEWCLANSQDYSVSSLPKIHAFMVYEMARRGNIADTTRHQVVVRDLIPVLQRVAELQGYDNYTKNLSKSGMVGILCTDLLRKANAERASEVQDYAATSRYHTKRLKPSEAASITKVIWTSSSSSPTHDRKTMRRSIMHHIPSSDGRR